MTNKTYKVDGGNSKKVFIDADNIKIMPEPLYFDLETTHLFEDLGMMRREEKNPIRLPMAVAGILYFGQTTFYEANRAGALAERLEQAELIVGHNVLEFDYPIAEVAAGRQLAPAVRAHTVDMFARIKSATRDWVSLDDLAKENLGKRKTYKGKEIPAMWRAGKREEVLEYLRNDLFLTAEVYSHGKTIRTLRYPEKDYGKPTGRMKQFKVDW